MKRTKKHFRDGRKGLCGEWVGRPLRVTKASDVTCKRCKKLMKRLRWRLSK